MPAPRLLGVIATGLHAVRVSPLHTALSMLGLIIGVAALVGILALGDGMERYGREQIATTTSLEMLTVTPRQTERVDGVLVQRASVPTLDRAAAEALHDALSEADAVALVRRRTVTVRAAGDTAQTAFYLAATQAAVARVLPLEVSAGRFFSAQEEAGGASVLVLSDGAARRVSPSGKASGALGREVEVAGVRARVVGVLASDPAGQPTAFGPVTAFEDVIDGEGRSAVVVRAARVEAVQALRREIEDWLANRYGAEAAFEVGTNRTRVAQVTHGVRLFKVVMGLITGIAVVVGGVGVMNVLLISVTERTREIGIRKAVGARPRDIVVQFLTESVVISAAGCLLGLVVGLAGVFAVRPLVDYLAGVTLPAAVSAGTVAIVLAIALLIGLLFGTYPAARAARLEPVEAIRQE